MASSPLLTRADRIFVVAPRGINETVARNLRALRDWGGQSQQKAAAKSNRGVSQKTLSNMMSPTPPHSATLDKIHGAAVAFDVSPWILLLEHFPANHRECNALAQLVENYLGASPDGKELIEQIARREAQRSGRPMTAA